MKILILILSFSLSTSAASYKGKNVDGKKLDAVVKSTDFISDARVIFDGRYVEIYLGMRIIRAKMAGEVIDNPHDIVASDGTDIWTINVSGLD
jgi:hypothetical protein